MNETLILQIALVGNAVVVFGSIVVAFKYYLATQELHQAIKYQDEQDGLKYGQSFQAQLWNERKIELEKSVEAYKAEHEKVTNELLELRERFKGLEQAYHEARQQLNPVLLKEAQEEEKPKRRGKR